MDAGQIVSSWNSSKIYSINMKKLFWAASFAVVLASCGKGGKVTTETPTDYGKGVLVINEGLFTGGTGTLSFIGDNADTILNNVYELENKKPLGNIGQSIAVADNQIALVVNNANKMELIDKSSFRTQGTVSGLKLPDEVIFTNGNYYVSEWVDFSGSAGSVAVISKSGTILKRINVGKTPSKMVVGSNQLMYVTNSGDSTVSVIDLSTNTEKYRITVGDRPNSLCKDASGVICVCFGGVPSWQGTPTAPGFVRMAANNVISKKKLATGVTIDHLVSGGSATMGYYLNNGAVHKLKLSDFTGDVEIKTGSFYGLAVDPTNGMVWATDAGNFTAAGSVSKMDSAGNVMKTYAGGIIPRNFGFIR